MRRGKCGVTAAYITRAEEQAVIGGLCTIVKGMIADYNAAVGDAVYYFSECLGLWVLFKKQKNRCDKRVATGLVTVEGLAALIGNLEKELKI